MAEQELYRPPVVTLELQAIEINLSVSLGVGRLGISRLHDLAQQEDEHEELWRAQLTEHRSESFAHQRRVPEQSLIGLGRTEGGGVQSPQVGSPIAPALG
jgi:hypothetical protein